MSALEQAIQEFEDQDVSQWTMDEVRYQFSVLERELDEGNITWFAVRMGWITKFCITGGLSDEDLAFVQTQTRLMMTKSQCMVNTQSNRNACANVSHSG